ncbi:hypothetical protein VP14_216 [Vibrio phage VPMCC14]|nr:hypothetical protein VP14_216 [Vibrio phage VPMCC14]
MRIKEQIVKDTCLDYVVKHLKLEVDKYLRLSHNHPCKGIQWQLVIHLSAIFKTLVSLDTEAHREHKELFEMIDKFEKEK